MTTDCYLNNLRLILIYSVREMLTEEKEMDKNE